MKKFGLFILFFGLFSFISMSVSAQTTANKDNEKTETVKTCCKSGGPTTACCKSGQATKCTGHGEHKNASACSHANKPEGAKCCANKSGQAHPGCCKNRANSDANEPKKYNHQK